MTNDKLIKEVAEAIADALDLAISERAKPLDIDYIRDAAQAAIDVMLKARQS